MKSPNKITGANAGGARRLQVRDRRISIALVITGAVSIFALLLSHFGSQKRISMALVEYRKWPHGAILRLRNDTAKTIRYIAEPNQTPMGAPLLRAEKTPAGWGRESVTIDSDRFYTGSTLGTNDVLFIKPATPKPGEHLVTLLTRDIRPGESVDFFVFLEPRAPPVRYGTMCLLPQSKLAQRMEPWTSRVQQWCRMKKKLPGQVEVWCQQPLTVSESGEPLATR